MTYNDWAKLVSGLMNDTPLGKMVEIRCETDADVIKSMTSEQHKIRSEWDSFRLKSSPKLTKEEMLNQSKMLENMLSGLFGKEA